MTLYGKNEEILTIPYDHLLVDRPLSWRVVIDNRAYWIPKSKAEIDEDTKVLFMGRW
jgi:hypothetical protein